MLHVSFSASMYGSNIIEILLCMRTTSEKPKQNLKTQQLRERFHGNDLVFGKGENLAVINRFLANLKDRVAQNPAGHRAPTASSRCRGAGFARPGHDGLPLAVPCCDLGFDLGGQSHNIWRCGLELIQHSMRDP